MPTYLFGKDSFLEFVKKYLGDDTVVVVSSDVLDVSMEKIESHLGVKDHYKVEFAISADIFKEKDVDEFDEKIKYVMVFVKKNDLTESALKSIR
jgi:hypothetical protein